MEEEEDEVNHSSVCLYTSVSEEICLRMLCKYINCVAIACQCETFMLDSPPLALLLTCSPG